MKQDVLDLISEYIEMIEHNFPRTHDDEVKINILTDLLIDIKEIKEHCLGFTPEEIAHMAKFYKDKTSVEEIEYNMKTAAKLMEWAKWKDIETENRLIILPCKIGDKAYRVYEHETETCIGKCESCDTDCSSYDICWHSKYEWRVVTCNADKEFLYKYWNAFGKTVFLTYEEAEAEANARHCKLKIEEEK